MDKILTWLSLTRKKSPTDDKVLTSLLTSLRKSPTDDKILAWLGNTPIDGPASILFIRLMVGGIFITEGILKFVFENQYMEQFKYLPIPFQPFSAWFVGVYEIIGGTLIIFGFFTRLVAVPFIFEMIVAILLTLHLGTSPLYLPPSPVQTGTGAVIHELSSACAQIMTLIFLCLAGPGKISLDAKLSSKNLH